MAEDYTPQATPDKVQYHDHDGVNSPLISSSSTKSSVKAYVGTNKSVGTGIYIRTEFDTIDWDIAEDYNITTNRFTAPRSSRYLINTSIQITNSTKSLMMSAIYVNGLSPQILWKIDESNSSLKTFTFTGILDMTAGDYFIFKFSQSTGSTQTINSGAEKSWINIQEL